MAHTGGSKKAHRQTQKENVTGGGEGNDQTLLLFKIIIIFLTQERRLGNVDKREKTT